MGRGGGSRVISGGASRGGLGGGVGRGGLGGGAARGGGFGVGGVGRAPVPRAPMGRAGSFGAGMAAGMGMGMMAGGGRRRRGWGWGGGWGGGWGRRRRMPMGGMGMGMGPGMMGPRRRGGGCGGCMTVLLVIIAIVLVFSIISWIGNLATPQNWAQQGGPIADVTASTVVREALPSGSANETGPLFTDNLGWIGNRTQLETGMRNFHRATGVRPHLYLVGEINGSRTPTAAQVEAYARDLYDQLFTDEAHLLVVFFENNASPPLIIAAAQIGTMARSVIDQEAEDILYDYIFRYYGRDRLTEEQVFSNAFNSTAERIMRVPPDNRAIWQTVIIVAGVLLLVFILFRWWQRKQEQKNLEAEQLERVLNQPLEPIGNPMDDATQRAQQYQDPNGPFGPGSGPNNQ